MNKINFIILYNLKDIKIIIIIEIFYLKILYKSLNLNYMLTKDFEMSFYERLNIYHKITKCKNHQDLQICAISVLATGFLVLALFHLLFQCQFL